MKILVIDDEPSLRRMICKMLQHDGCEVIEAADGQAGLLLARTHLPDLILCDFDMDGLNGYQTLAQLRASDATATIPFILMTGTPQRAGLRHSMELGADDYLAKPFDQTRLFNCVKARLARAQQNRWQAEQKLSALRSSILAALPDAFETPLNGIVGYSELLALDYDSFSREEIREMTTTIHESAQSLERLVARFLNYTDLLLLAARPPPNTRRDSPGAMIASAELDATARRVAERHRRQGDLVLQLEAGTPAMTQAHLSRLTEELVDNACKFSAPRSKIEIAATVRDNRFVLQVRDAGRGLTPEQIADAGAFRQFDRRRYEQPGTGLGLATARLLAELNDGSLTLQSEPGRGTTATVTLAMA